jgi:hypothetical protein
MIEYSEETIAADRVLENPFKTNAERDYASALLAFELMPDIFAHVSELKGNPVMFFRVAAEYINVLQGDSKGYHRATELITNLKNKC